MVAGLTAQGAIEGDVLLPELPWVEEDLAGYALNIKVGKEHNAFSILQDQMPDDYLEVLEKNPKLTESVLVYLTVSSQIVNKSEFDDLAKRTKDILQQLLFLKENECCSMSLATELQDIFALRQKLLAQKSI